jgi:hypothetical protein
MSGIEVQVTDDGPALFEVVLADRQGEELGARRASLPSTPRSCASAPSGSCTRGRSGRFRPARSASGCCDTNGIRFNQLDRQRLRRIRHHGSQPTTDQEASAA